MLVQLVSERTVGGSSTGCTGDVRESSASDADKQYALELLAKDGFILLSNKRGHAAAVQLWRDHCARHGDVDIDHLYQTVDVLLAGPRPTPPQQGTSRPRQLAWVRPTDIAIVRRDDARSAPAVSPPQPAPITTTSKSAMALLSNGRPSNKPSQAMVRRRYGRRQGQSSLFTRLNRRPCSGAAGLDEKWNPERVDRCRVRGGRRSRSAAAAARRRARARSPRDGCTPCRGCGRGVNGDGPGELDAFGCLVVTGHGLGGLVWCGAAGHPGGRGRP